MQNNQVTVQVQVADAVMFHSHTEEITSNTAQELYDAIQAKFGQSAFVSIRRMDGSLAFRGWALLGIKEMAALFNK